MSYLCRPLACLSQKLHLQKIAFKQTQGLWTVNCLNRSDYFNKKLSYRRGIARPTRYDSKFMLFHEVWKLERFQTAKLAFNVILWNWCGCHSIGHIRFPISAPLQLCSYHAPLTRCYIYFYFANTVQHKVNKLKQSKKARTIRTIYRVKTIK